MAEFIILLALITIQAYIRHRANIKRLLSGTENKIGAKINIRKVCVMAKVSIIGTGNWGIALGMVLAQNGHEVTAWSALPELSTKGSYTCKNLPGVEIENIVFTADLQEACTDKEMLVLSVLQYLPEEQNR